MTFEQFQETGRTVALSTVDSIAPFVDEDALGRVYKGELYIELNDDGTYTLTISNSSRSSSDLTELERDLYDWASREGYFE